MEGDGGRNKGMFRNASLSFASKVELKKGTILLKKVVFPKGSYELKPGDYVQVRINDATQATLLGEIVA